MLSIGHYKNFLTLIVTVCILLTVELLQSKISSSQVSDQIQQLGTGNSIDKIDSINFGEQENNIDNQEIENQYIDYDIPSVSSLDNYIFTPVNTENDFGFNMSFGINTLKNSNMTVYLGVIFQPGRTNSHKARMELLKKRTDFLGVQEQIAKVKLEILRQKITEAEAYLQKLEK